MSGDNAAYLDWLAKATEDEYAGKDILAGRHFPAPACFHFQQMTEKQLKALLLFYQKEFPKTHDLVLLAKLLEDVVPDVHSLSGDLEFLNRYYVETRYPADYPEFTWDECEKAGDASGRIKEFVLKKIGTLAKNRGFVIVKILGIAALILLAGGLFLLYRRTRIIIPERGINTSIVPPASSE